MIVFSELISIATKKLEGLSQTFFVSQTLKISRFNLFGWWDVRVFQQCQGSLIGPIILSVLWFYYGCAWSIRGLASIASRGLSGEAALSHRSRLGAICVVKVGIRVDDRTLDVEGGFWLGEELMLFTRLGFRVLIWNKRLIRRGKNLNCS